MTTITINEKINIKWKFDTFLDLYKYINENIEVKIKELDNQDKIINSNEYKNYNKILSNIKF